MAATWEWNIETGETVFNERWAHIIGYTLAEISPTSFETWASRTHPDDLEAANEKLKLHFKAPSHPYQIDVRMKHKNGEWIWISDRGSVTAWSNEGSPLIMQGICIDITKHKTAEANEKQAYDAQLALAGILKSITDAAIDAIVMMDPEGAITFWNPAATTLWGYLPDEVLGTEIHNLLMPEWYRESHNGALSEIQGTGPGNAAGRTVELPSLHKDGYEIPVELSISTIYRDSEWHTLWIIRDITIRKNSEKLLEKRNEEIRNLMREHQSILNSVPIGIATTLDRKVQFANNTFYEMTGYSEQETLQADARFFYSTQDGYEQFGRNAYSVITAGTRFSAENSFRRKNGLHFPVRITGGAINSDEPGEGFVWAFEDISEHKTSVDKIRKLSLAVDQAPIGVIITDKNQIIEYVNPMYYEISGYSIEEPVGKRAAMLKSGNTPAETYRGLWSTISAGNTWNGEFINKRKDGSIYHESAIVSPVFDDAGALTHYLAIKEDITEKKKLMEQLLHSQKVESIGQLAGGLAHDLNNILSVINGYGTLLKVKGGLNTKNIQYVDAIMEAVTEASSLSQSMLTYSRKQAMKSAVCDLNGLLTRIGQFAERLLPENIELIFTTASEPLPVDVDAGQIEQMMINLVTNARDAMPGGGTLRITTGVESGDSATLSDWDVANIHTRYAVIVASDTGHGMNEETMSRIFDPFFTTKEVGKGTGLGLAMVFGIIRQHNGDIDVQSSPENGTVFKIRLPLADTDAPAVLKVSGPAVGMKNDTEKRAGKILIAEDNRKFRLVLEDFLTEAGYHVILAKDGSEAVDKFKDDINGIDLVISDVIMPKKSGKTVFDEIHKLSATTKFIFMSGHTRDVITHQGDFGGAELLMKPVELPLLLRKVREFI